MLKGRSRNHAPVFSTSSAKSRVHLAEIVLDWDHQLSGAELGPYLIEDGLHSRRVSDNDEDCFSAVHSVLDGCMEIARILWSPIPAPHRVTVGDQVFCTRMW